VAESLRLVRAPDVYELRVYVGRDRYGRVKGRYERFAGGRAGKHMVPKQLHIRLGKFGITKAERQGSLIPLQG